MENKIIKVIYFDEEAAIDYITISEYVVNWIINAPPQTLTLESLEPVNILSYMAEGA